MKNFSNVCLFQVFIGLNDKDSHNQKVTTEEARGLLSSLIFKHLAGATLAGPFTGLYTYTDGIREIENSFTISVFDFDGDAAGRIAKLVKEAKKYLNQESILVTKQLINFAFM